MTRLYLFMLSIALDDLVVLHVQATRLTILHNFKSYKTDKRYNREQKAENRDKK